MFQTVSDADGFLMEPGNYRLKVLSVEEADDGQYGPSMLWKFLVADAANPDDFKVDANGVEWDFRAYTSTMMTPRARARAWTEALLGRPLSAGEKITPPDLVDRSMVALIVHKQGEDGQMRARVSNEVKPKPFGQSAPMPKATSGGAMSRDDLLAKATRGVKQAIALEAEGSEGLDGLDLSTMSDDQLKDLMRTLGDSIRAAAA